MNFFNYAHTDEIFSYLDDATGEQLHFNVTKMFDWCSAEARKLGPNEENSEFEMIRTPFDPHHVKHVKLGHWERFLVDIAIFNIKEYLGVSQYPEMGACI